MTTVEDAHIRDNKEKHNAANSNFYSVELATTAFISETSSLRKLALKPGANQLDTNSYVYLLGIDVKLEPDVVWIAREMCNSPLPGDSRMIISRSRISYFYDTKNDCHTLEHPLLRRYTKILETHRLDRLIIRSRPSIRKLTWTVPDLVFHNNYRNLQIPCQLCGLSQSTVKCEQCVQAFCDSCFMGLHGIGYKSQENVSCSPISFLSTPSTQIHPSSKDCSSDATSQEIMNINPRSTHTTVLTAHGSLCSSCSRKKPQCFCVTCEEFYCFPCYQTLHSKGLRREHKAQVVKGAHGDMVDPEVLCEECESSPADFRCDQCMDTFCVKCFWLCHSNGNRRYHTATQIVVRPLCTECKRIISTVFCEQCRELLCTNCFAFLHSKGNRKLHLFTSSVDFLLLLERIDPKYQEHFRRAVNRVLWGICKIQAWVKGHQERVRYNRQRSVLINIQSKWRGYKTRRDIHEIANPYQWRRKLVGEYILPDENKKQKYLSQYSRKKTTMKDTENVLDELKEAIRLIS